MKIAAPSNKVVSTFLTVVFLVTAVIVVSKINESRQNANADVPELTSADIIVKNQAKGDETDSDADGLPDWQETLWGTDPNKSDTDGDGTEDKTELENKRDPLVAGPNDTLVEKSDVLAGYIPSKTDKNSLTSVMARSLFTNYAELRGSDGISQESQAELIETLVDGASKEAEINDKYSPENFLTFTDNSPEKLKRYANDLVSIQQEEFLPIVSSEGNPDPEIIINAYSSIAWRYATMPVPADLIGPHSRITNNMNNIAIASERLKEYQGDPLKALLVMPVYQEVGDTQPVLYKQIADYIKNSGIIFDENEPGQILYEQ